MRIYCPEHKTSFLTPRRNPIRCENRGHILGEFVFAGDANAHAETVWQYCCNCGHFCPIDMDQGALAACPACGRRISQIYACHRCFTFTFESETAIQTKNFTLDDDGTPQPSCPGCLQECSVDLHEHDCEKLKARFTTSLNSCPICLDHLDVGPMFPSSVDQYLRKTRAANKLNVGFDYPTGLFLPDENGEFVLVNGTEDSRPLLPRSPRFESKRDFYELYQDYFHCANVNAGELYIIEPALVERAAKGWKLQSLGVLEIVDASPETDAVIDDVPDAIEFSVRERSAFFSPTLTEESTTAITQSRAPKIEKSPATTCAYCGSWVESRHAFCYSCGHPTKPDGSPAKETSKTITTAQRVFANDDESTVRHDVDRIQPSMFSWAFSEPSQPSSTASRLKLVPTLGIGLLLLGGFLLSGLLSQFGRNADFQQAMSVAAVAPKAEPTANATVEATTQSNPTIDHAEEELRGLRERRISTPPSDRSSVLHLFASTEKQYPDDYRFSYERAKLVIDAAETRSHDEAFDALSLAAEKAIKANKADEMLKSLEIDRMGDFHKLAHGHHEWSHIIEALKHKDATPLASN